MSIDLTHEETAALIRELDGIIANDRYFLSPRVQTLEAIRNKLRPEPSRNALPPTKHYEPPRVGAGDAGETGACPKTVRSPRAAVVSSGMDHSDPSEEPNLNTGTP